MTMYSILYLTQHKVDKRATVSQLGTLGYGIVIGLLVSKYHILHRQMGKGGVPPSED